LQVFRLDGAERAVEVFAGRFTIAPALRSDDLHVSLARLPAGGMIGRHPAAAPQLMIVVEGSGWVAGHDARPWAVRAGSAVYVGPGEDHETTTETGLTAVIVEGRAVQRPT
jgi:quercetin dioxygenase-like cupin family protein